MKEETCEKQFDVEFNCVRFRSDYDGEVSIIICCSLSLRSWLEEERKLRRAFRLAK